MYENLMEEAVEPGNCRRALGAVERNQGAPGIDRMKTRELEAHLQAHWEKIRAKLLAGTYVASPVRRVEIPKPGGGMRKLGIPTVLDRFIQQLLLQAMTPIFEPGFSEHSYGFRPGRSAHDAVAAAERTMVSIQKWIEKHLRLKVNAAKSGTGRVWERKFLGFRLNRERQIEVAAESLERFQAEVREMWRSCQSRTSNQLRDAWQRYAIGWWGYYRLAEARRPIFRLEGWIRRHIRKRFWLRWHSAAGRERRLRRLGLAGRMLKVAWSSRGAWNIARTGSLHAALNHAMLRRSGFPMPSDLAAP